MVEIITVLRKPRPRETVAYSSQRLSEIYRDTINAISRGGRDNQRYPEFKYKQDRINQKYL